MPPTPSLTAPRGFARVFGWRRLRLMVVVSLLFGLFFSANHDTPWLVWALRVAIVGMAVLLAFGVFERRPKKLPKWLARSALQIVAIAIFIPPASALAFAFTNGFGSKADVSEKTGRMFGEFTFACILFAPWIAVGAIFKQRGALAREQALAFDLEKSELERKALDARLRLLQAQVEPHFIFNTLANVQALVESGSPQASAVLASLIAYLKAAVPRVHESTTTLDQELQLVRAYLEVMQMRMPDRLQFSIRLDPDAKRLLCPPITLLTLVENSVRHGIDPSEEGGRIDIDVSLRGRRCYVSVTDTGVGLCVNAGAAESGVGLGTGLSTLRERLRLTFGDDAQLRLTDVKPHGARAEAEFPAREKAS
ncbi:MAG TPA: histidine kinase [Steroidobacteraceae bacterium]|nr:histidine kinase [Steroidobacteraceae bacterium]